MVRCAANGHGRWGALKSRELTTREWTSRHEEAGVDIARVDNVARRSKGGQRGSGQGGTKKRVDNAGVDNTGVAKHEQRRGMSRNHTEERQQLNAPVTHAPALSVDYKSKHCLTR